MIICLYIAYYIFKDDWNSYDYPAGGITECIVIIFVAFIPLLNIVFSFFIGGIHLIEKLKGKYER